MHKTEVLEELHKFHNSIIFMSLLYLLRIDLVMITTRHPHFNKLNFK
jgi:hypothetical protein